MAKRTKSEKEETWVQTHWRAMMAWQYLVVCLFDFILAPIALGAFSFYTKSSYVPWAPLTIQGGGLYHLAMGAIIGVTSYGRTQEKVNLINNPYTPAPGQVAPPIQPKVAPIVAADPEQ